MRRRVSTIHGLILVDKPGGPTSHDVVARARRALHEKRIGHAGTLDPMATGLLGLLVGAATRLSEYLVEKDKRYTATVRFGRSTNTYDAEGETVAAKEVRARSRGAARIPQDQPPGSGGRSHREGPWPWLPSRRGPALARPPRSPALSLYSPGRTTTASRRQDPHRRGSKE